MKQTNFEKNCRLRFCRSVKNIKIDHNGWTVVQLRSNKMVFAELSIYSDSIH